MEAVDFELEISGGRSRRYLVVARSPAGEASAVMRFRGDEQMFARQLLSLQLALSRSETRVRRLPSDDEEPVQEFGRQLFELLISGDVRALFEASRTRAGDENKHLRVVLRIRVPELASLPWEFMYDGRRDDYLCLNASMVRYTEVMEPLRPLTVTPPLRILAMVARPSDQDDIDAEEEKRRLVAALEPLEQSGRVEMKWVDGQTWRHLQRAVHRSEWHVFHFIGHGGFDRRAAEGLIALTDELGGTHRLGATKLSQLIGSRRSLRLVVLNACESGRASANDVFSSTASVLTRRGVPAVLAMQYEISDRAAIEFSRAFYEAVADAWRWTRPSSPPGWRSTPRSRARWSGVYRCFTSAPPTGACSTSTPWVAPCRCRRTAKTARKNLMRSGLGKPGISGRLPGSTRRNFLVTRRRRQHRLHPCSTGGPSLILCAAGPIPSRWSEETLSAP